ncbi:hypothetical protein EYR38_009909 [Pleurotus pulmonarius]|nr:hypothetical protein EYR38_009909 [Pleurotus pulmonarius]
MYSLRKRYAAFALAAAWFCLATGCSNHRRNTNTTNEDAAPLDIPFPPCEFQGALRTIGCDLRRLADIGYAPPPLISATLPDYRLVRIAQEAYTAGDKVVEKAYSRLRCLLGETQCFAVEVESPSTSSQRALRQTSAAMHASTDEANNYLGLCLLPLECFAVEVEPPSTSSQRALQQISGAMRASTDEANSCLGEVQVSCC